MRYIKVCILCMDEAGFWTLGAINEDQVSMLFFRLVCDQLIR